MSKATTESRMVWALVRLRPTLEDLRLWLERPDRPDGPHTYGNADDCRACRVLAVLREEAPDA